MVMLGFSLPLFSVSFLPHRNRVKSVFTPGMAGGKSFDAQTKSFPKAPYLYRLNHVLRTRWGVSARIGKIWRNNRLV